MGDSRVEDILEDTIAGNEYDGPVMSRVEELLVELNETISGASDLPDVTSSDNGKVLKVIDGEWDKGDDISNVVHYVNCIVQYALDYPMDTNRDVIFTGYPNVAAAYTEINRWVDNNEEVVLILNSGNVPSSIRDIRLDMDHESNSTDGLIFVNVLYSPACNKTLIYEINLTSYMGGISKLKIREVTPNELPVPTSQDNGKFVGVSNGSYNLISGYSKTEIDAFINATDDALDDEIAARIAGDNAKADVIEDTASGSIASFTDGTGKNADELIVGIEPVQSGSGNPSPSNVRPINGWTGANVVVCGKNLCDNTSFQSGYINSTGVIASSTNRKYCDYIGVIPNTSYTLSGTDLHVSPTVTTANVNVAFFTKSKEFISITETSSVGDVYTYTTPNNCAYVIASVGASATNVQFEQDTTPTIYEPYQGNTYTIDLDGTRYGGTLNVTTGELTVDRALFTIDGNTTLNRESSWKVGAYRTAEFADMKSFVDTSGTDSNFKCDLFVQKSYNRVAGANEYYYEVAHYGKRLVVSLGADYDTATKASAFFEATPLHACVLLATPITVQLTPTEVATLVGTNNIFADTGDVSVTYKADTKGYVDGNVSEVNNNISEVNTKISELKQTEADIIAPTENGTTASQAYAKGEYFLRNDQFCKAKTAIASGATFTLDTNYEITGIGDEIKSQDDKVPAPSGYYGLVPVLYRTLSNIYGPFKNYCLGYPWGWNANLELRRTGQESQWDTKPIIQVLAFLNVTAAGQLNFDIVFDYSGSSETTKTITSPNSLAVGTKIVIGIECMATTEWVVSYYDSQNKQNEYYYFTAGGLLKRIGVQYGAITANATRCFARRLNY